MPGEFLDEDKFYIDLKQLLGAIQIPNLYHIHLPKE